MASLAGCALVSREGSNFAHGGHVEQSTPLCDVIELTGDHEFLLHAVPPTWSTSPASAVLRVPERPTEALRACSTARFFMPDAQGPAVRRKPADGRGGRTLLEHCATDEQLRQRIDPVFLPRPLLLVDRLRAMPPANCPITPCRRWRRST